MCTATEELEKETKKKDGKNEDNSQIDVIPRKDAVQAKSPV